MCGRYALGSWDTDEVAERLATQYFDNGPSHRGTPPRRRQNRRRDRSSEDGDEDDHDVDDDVNDDNNNDEGSRVNEEVEGDSHNDALRESIQRDNADLVENTRLGTTNKSPTTPILPWANKSAKENYRPRFNVAPQSRCLVVRRMVTEFNPVPSYTLDIMKWGLIPHWQKHPPDRPLKTINARDDTLFSGAGMWSGIRGKKRCVVITEGFYEWMTKGKDKIPHFTKRADGKFMIMAGLWDSVTFEGEKEPLTSFTIITTSSNKQLSFLHDRMPAVLQDSDEIQKWLSDAPWSPEIQRLVRPFPGDLECYKVPQEVGKVGNESPDFVKPISERKGNLASMFAQQKASPKKSSPPDTSTISSSPRQEAAMPSAKINEQDQSALSFPLPKKKGVHGRDDSIEIMAQDGDNDKPSKKTKTEKTISSPKTRTRGALKGEASPDSKNPTLNAFFSKEE